MSATKPLPFDPAEQPSTGPHVAVEHHFDGAGDVIDATVHVDGDRLRVATDHCGDVDLPTSADSKFGDPWKWRCPNGHTAWVVRLDGTRKRGSDGSKYYVCRTCEKYGDPVEFDELVHADDC